MVIFKFYNLRLAAHRSNLNPWTVLPDRDICNDLGYKFSNNSVQTFSFFLANFEEYYFLSKYCNFLGNFCKNLATFYLHIWSYCQWKKKHFDSSKDETLGR